MPNALLSFIRYGDSHSQHPLMPITGDKACSNFNNRSLTTTLRQVCDPSNSLDYSSWPLSVLFPRRRSIESHGISSRVPAFIVVRQHNKIGWEQLFCGRFSKLGAAINMPLQTMQTPKEVVQWTPLHGEQNVTRSGGKSASNNVVNGHDLASKNIIKQEQAVKEIYLKRDQLQ